MGDTPQDGAVDHSGRVFGYQNLMVLDGSILPVSPGPNPAHTILAVAERAMKYILRQMRTLGVIQAEEDPPTSENWQEQFILSLRPALKRIAAQYRLDETRAAASLISVLRLGTGAWKLTFLLNPSPNAPPERISALVDHGHVTDVQKPWSGEDSGLSAELLRQDGQDFLILGQVFTGSWRQGYRYKIPL